MEKYKVNKENNFKKTKETWQPYYDHELTDSDAEEICRNMTNYLKLLIKWDKQKQERSNLNDSN